MYAFGNVNVGSVYRSLVRASRSISDTCTVLVALNYGEGHEIIHRQARAFFKHWINTTDIEAGSFSGKKIGEIRLCRNGDRLYQIFNASMSAERSVVEKSVREWIWYNRSAMSSDALLSKEIVSFVKKFFRPFDHIIFSLTANYDEKSFVAANIRIKINEFLTDLYAFTFGDQSPEIGDFVGFDSHPGEFGFSLLQTIHAYCMQSWFAYQKDYDRFAPILLDYERDHPGITQGRFTISQVQVSFHEFIILMLSECGGDAFYRKHFCQFNFDENDRNNDYKIAQRIILLLDNSNLTASDLEVSSLRDVKESTLNATFRFLVNKIQCQKIKSVLESYIYSDDVQKKARKEMDYSMRLEYALKELAEFKELALKKYAPKSDGDGMCVSLFFEQCVYEVLDRKLYAHNQSLPHGESDMKIFIKYLNLFLVHTYSGNKRLLKYAFKLLDDLSDKENIQQVRIHLDQEYKSFTNGVNSSDELIAGKAHLCDRVVGAFINAYEYLLMEKVKRLFFASISVLPYTSLKIFSVEKLPYYCMVQGDAGVQYAIIIFKRCSDYVHDGKWISLASFMEKIKSDFESFSDIMDDANLEEICDSVIVSHWRKKIGAEEAVEETHIAGIVSILQQPSWKEHDLKQLEANNLHLQSELARQKDMLSSRPNLFKANDGFCIDVAIRRIEEVAMIIAFLKKLYSAESPGSEACIADFDSCLASLRVADDTISVSVNQKRRKRGRSKRNQVAVSLGCDNNPSHDDQYPAAILADSLSSNVYLSSEGLIKQRSVARKERCIQAIMELKQECEKDVQMILSEAIADHRGCARHDSLEVYVEKILNKRRGNTFFSYTSKWPAAKIAYIRSLIVNDDFNRANNIVLFLKKSNIYFSYIKNAQWALNELSTVSHPVLKSYCTDLMNERVDEAYTDWITDIGSLNSKNDLMKSYVFSKPYTVYLSQGERYKGEWHDVMLKLHELFTETDSKKYDELLRTQYSFTWSKSPHPSERALHLLWQRLRCDVHVTEPALKRLVPGFESMFTPANRVNYNRILAILKIIQMQSLEQFLNEFKGELTGGSRQARCESLANGLKDRVLKKTIDRFIVTVFKDPHFCETLKARGTTPTFKASSVLQLSHAAKQCLTGMLPAGIFAHSGLTEFLIKPAPKKAGVPSASSIRVPGITYTPEVLVPAPLSEQEIPKMICEPLPLESVFAQKTPQATAEEVLKEKVLEIHKKILQATENEDCAKRFSLFCMPVTVKGSLPATLQKLKNYIEQHPLIEYDEIEKLQEHVRALEAILSQRQEYAFFDPRVRTDVTEKFYKEILDSALGL